MACNVLILAVAAPLAFGQASTAPKNTSSAAAAAGKSAIAATRSSPRPAFEVASVKPDKPEAGNNSDIDISGNRIHIVEPLIYCIEAAYSVKDYQISAPEWLRDERFDIQAIEPAGTHDKNAWRPMLQTLLAQRFHLKLHKETRRLPVYALVVAKKGPKLQKSDGSGGSSIRGRNDRYTFSGVSMPGLADMLSRTTSRPVVDQTALTGRFSFTLQFATERELEASKGSGSDDPGIFTALQEQLGLKLVAKKAPIEFLVVDSADKTPSEN